MMGQLIQELPRFFTYYNLIFLAQAVGTTIALSAIGCLFGLLFGCLISVVRLTEKPWLAPLRWIALLFTEFFRRVPFLVTLMLIFFVFQLSGANLPLFVVASLSVTLIASAFLAEIIRAGLLSIHHNQWDAATAMNFSLLQSIRYVVLPQGLLIRQSAVNLDGASLEYSLGHYKGQLPGTHIPWGAADAPVFAVNSYSSNNYFHFLTDTLGQLHWRDRVPAARAAHMIVSG